jgi:hypothetical protein
MKGTRIGTRAVALACVGWLALAGAAVGGTVKKGNYRGTTSERGAVSFKVSSNGKRVLAFTTAIGYNGKCGQGGGPAFTVTVPSMKLRSDGRFSGVGLGTLSTLKPVVIKVNGRIKGRKATGYVEDPSAVHCASGPNKGAAAYGETFTATA